MTLHEKGEKVTVDDLQTHWILKDNFVWQMYSES